MVKFLLVLIILLKDLIMNLMKHPIDDDLSVNQDHPHHYFHEYEQYHYLHDHHRYHFHDHVHWFHRIYTVQMLLLLMMSVQYY
jgi:hypothetical protein